MATAANGLPYVGNADYRGYLSAQAQAGDPNATAALNYVGNDGVWNPNQSTVPLSSDALNSAKSYNNQAYYTWLTGGSGGSGGSGSPNTNASDLAYLDSYDSGLRGQLASAQNTLGQGLTQLEDTYNQQATRTNQDKNTADTGFNTQRTQTTQDKQKNQDVINNNARSLSDSVRSVLGLAGGSNSSAYQITAPQAIARDTTEKTSANSDTFGRNIDAENNAQSATDLKFQRALQDLGDQRKQKESDLQSGVLSNENSITQQLAQNALTRSQINGGTFGSTSAALQPFTQSMADRQSAIDNLFNQYRTPYTLQDTAPVAANTSSFTPAQTNINTTPAPANASGSGDNSTYLQALLKKFAPTPASTPAAPVGATA